MPCRTARGGWSRIARRRHQLSHSSAFDERIDSLGGGIERLLWLRLAHQGAMQLDLEDLRQLRINRSHGPWRRALDRTTRIVEGDGNRAAQPRIMIERWTRR